MNSDTPSMPEVVYHYTSLDVMTKVVDSKSIWATSISYLNDESERQYTLEAIHKRLSTLVVQRPELNEMLKAFPYQDTEGLTSFMFEEFISSFSSEHDSLMHWRSYCPPRSGVSIGFRVACLKQARIAAKAVVGTIVSPSGFGKVNYVCESNLGRIDEMIERAYTRYKQVKSSAHATSPYYPGDADLMRLALKGEAWTTKRPSFSGEAEYRLVQPGLFRREEEIKFRSVASTLVPYVPMHIPATGQLSGVWDAIQRVVLGPTANMKLSLRSVQAFFAARGLHVDVTASEIPYRDW